MKTVLITGANRGIGLSFVKHYIAQSYRVIATSRSPSQELTDLGAINVKLDLFSDESIAGLPNVLKDFKIDILIHNAGILFTDTIESANRQEMLDQFNINTIAPLLVTKTLLSSLVNPSKIICITSSMGSVAENGSGGYYGYRASKSGLNMLVKSLSIDLKSRGIAVIGLHPGYIQTGMTGGKGEMGPDEAVVRLAKRIEEFGMEQTGEFRHRDGRIIPY